MTFRPHNHPDRYVPWAQRGGYDEYSREEEEAERRRHNYLRTRRATQKQIDFANALIERAKRHDSLKENVAVCEMKLRFSQSIASVQWVINTLKTELDKLATARKAEAEQGKENPVASETAETTSETAPAPQGKPATPKQLGFIKSLVAKKILTDEIEALRSAELTTTTASTLIELLLASDDKTKENVEAN
jgi:hypothetical protein